MSKGNDGPIYTMRIDVQVSRRKRFHYLYDADGALIYTAQKTSDLYAILVELEAASVWIISDAACVRLDLVDVAPF